MVSLSFGFEFAYLEKEKQKKREMAKENFTFHVFLKYVSRFVGSEFLLGVTVPIGLRAWMAGEGWFDNSLKFSDKTLMIRAKVHGRKHSKRCQGQACRLLSLTFASSKQS